MQVPTPASPSSSELASPLPSRAVWQYPSTQPMSNHELPNVGAKHLCIPRHLHTLISSVLRAEYRHLVELPVQLRNRLCRLLHSQKFPSKSVHFHLRYILCPEPRNEIPPWHLRNLGVRHRLGPGGPPILRGVAEEITCAPNFSVFRTGASQECALDIRNPAHTGNGISAPLKQRGRARRELLIGEPSLVMLLCSSNGSRHPLINHSLELFTDRGDDLRDGLGDGSAHLVCNSPGHLGGDHLSNRSWGHLGRHSAKAESYESHIAILNIYIQIQKHS
ncbi:hypothetical protein LXL04_032484 [Taraxacum kok-saghyz]